MNTQILLVLSGVLQTLATVARNPAIGVDPTAGNTYADLLELASRLVLRGDDAIEDLEDLKDEVDEMVETGTKPDQSKIDEWKARSDKAHAELQAMKERPDDDEPELDDDNDDEPDDDLDSKSRRPLG